MVIFYGTGFYGKIARVNNQWIETQFFTIMFFPVFPLSSMFVTSSEFRRRQGFSMPINYQSVAAVYLRLAALIIAAVLFYKAILYLPSRYQVLERDYSESIKMALWGMFFLAAWAYFIFFFGKVKQEDISMRNRVGEITGMYALPHWFDYVQQKDFLRVFLS